MDILRRYSTIQIAMYTVGIATFLAGMVGVLTDDKGFDRLVYGATTLAGLVILITANFAPDVAKYVICFVPALLVSVPIYQDTTDYSIMGYLVCIILAGTLIGGTAIWIVSLVCLVTYAAALLYNNASDIPFDRVSIVILTILISSALMTIFANTLRSSAKDAQSRAIDLEVALVQLREKQALERQTGAAIVGVMERLRNISTEQLGNVQEQVSALTEVTSTIEELSRAALQIAEAASAVDNSAEETLQAASRSQGAVNDSLQAMLLIKAQVQQIVERTIALNERIQRIGDVTGVVSSIAAQTHLLALNAAIEAAGAGVAGERFAIVAGEVKKLAQRSQREASEIRDLVAEVQRANAASVMATEQGLKESDKGSAQARSAADANLEVIDNVSATTSRAKAITMATQQQRSASTQVVDTMYHLREAAQSVAHAAISINQTISELSALATQLGTRTELPHREELTSLPAALIPARQIVSPTA